MGGGLRAFWVFAELLNGWVEWKPAARGPRGKQRVNFYALRNWIIIMYCYFIRAYLDHWLCLFLSFLFGVSFCLSSMHGRHGCLENVFRDYGRFLLLLMRKISKYATNMWRKLYTTWAMGYGLWENRIFLWTPQYSIFYISIDDYDALYLDLSLPAIALFVAIVRYLQMDQERRKTQIHSEIASSSVRAVLTESSHTICSDADGVNAGI